MVLLRDHGLLCVIALAFSVALCLGIPTSPLNDEMSGPSPTPVPPKPKPCAYLTNTTCMSHICCSWCGNKYSKTGWCDVIPADVTPWTNCSDADADRHTKCCELFAAAGTPCSEPKAEP